MQSLHLYPGADKAAALTAITDAAHRDHRHVLALPATPQTHAYASTRPYADNAAHIQQTPTEQALAKIRELADAGRRLPRGNLVIVDDADHLAANHLQWLANNAAATNTKLLLITTPDQRTPDHTLTAALDHLLPWAHHLGTPDPAHQRTRTAIERTEHHLAAAPDITSRCLLVSECEFACSIRQPRLAVRRSPSDPPGGGAGLTLRCLLRRPLARVRSHAWLHVLPPGHSRRDSVHPSWVRRVGRG